MQECSCSLPARARCLRRLVRHGALPTGSLPASPPHALLVMHDVLLVLPRYPLPTLAAGMMFVLLYGRKGVFAPLIAKMGFPIVFAFPGKPGAGL